MAAGIESPAIGHDRAFAGEQEQEEDGVGVVGNVDTDVDNHQNQKKEDGSVVVDNALSTTTDNNDDDYLSRRKLQGIVMSAFDCGGVASVQVAADI